jgi:NADPH:quinone reductase-like Zn-dependent oxidoreductase
LKPGGRLVTIVALGAQASERDHKAHFVVEPNTSQLARIGTMIDRGEIRWFQEAVLPLENAREAYAQASVPGKRGKVAVEVV